MTVTRRLAVILAADCDEISETGLLVALVRSDCCSTECRLRVTKRTRGRQDQDALRLTARGNFKGQ